MSQEQCRAGDAQAGFKLTYATMFSPPPELHQRFDEALAAVRADLGREYGLIIDGREVMAVDKLEDRNPADTGQVLALMQQGAAEHARQAIAAAARALPAWSATPWQERVARLRRAAALIRERIFVIAVANCLSVGKNRMESLGDIAETADLVDYACDRLEAAQGFAIEMGRDPLPGCQARNWSVLKPYGVWLVVAPFNFPGALCGGPAGAALAAGNTVVLKCSSDTPWPSRLVAECFAEALPAGAFNFVTGPGATLGQALIDDPRVAGITFTGSHPVGMAIHRQFAQGLYVRPAILELGGKNPAIVSQKADLDVAALGVMRSAFGLQGQKCSACSRVFVERPVYAEFLERLAALTRQIVIGDPARREVYLGPVANAKARETFARCCEELAKNARLVTGGAVLTEGEYAQGHFCAPTVAADAPADHPLWTEEMFAPITMVAAVDDLDQAMARANDTIYGLTAGFYGAPEEVDWFFRHIRCGVAYANRPSGATTGAWPGYQPFGGWQASGASGKNSGGEHYLQLYMREQIQARLLP
ncbi:MAG: aldehyde dehydrogenase family protein [Thermodesulfobacteriota bacterium]